jgi:hypothetical protein
LSDKFNDIVDESKKVDKINDKKNEINQVA